MIRRTIVGLVIGALLIVGAVAADDPKPDEPEPPVRLKKKDKPNEPAPEKKPAAPKEDDKEKPKEDPKEKTKLKRADPDDPEPEADEKETLARINKNMRASEDRLAKKDAGDGTRQIQRDVLKDLDSLLEQKKKQQQQQSAQQQNQQNSQNQRSQRSQASRGSRSSRSQSGNSQSTADGSKPSGSSNQAGGGNSSAKNADNRMADVFKDVWGHLPAELRMEMDTYSKEKFMARYKELLEQYYATIAEKGRRKGD